jgi:hypothetical protein
VRSWPEPVNSSHCTLLDAESPGNYRSGGLRAGRQLTSDRRRGYLLTMKYFQALSLLRFVVSLLLRT